MVRYVALKGFYNVEKTIGCGGFAKVKLATHIATGEKVAIKIMEKSVLGDDLPRVELELKALKTMAHPHICKLYQVLETETHYFIVIEYCSGGELFDHIVERNRLAEDESRLFFRQIVSAVAYLHSLGYAHRDLKPENVLLNRNQTLKIIDFGLCAKPEGGIKSPLSTACGSPTYAAPELVLGREYLGSEIDVWSMGVLLYALLCGYLPFDDQNIDSLYKKIVKGKYSEPPFISKESKEFIKCMLQVEPKSRITVTEMLVHPWITAGGRLKPLRVCFENNKLPDEDCVSIMAQYHGVTVEYLWKNLASWQYDYNTATYLLLNARKKRGLPLALNSTANRISISSRMHYRKNLKTIAVAAVANNNIGYDSNRKEDKENLDSLTGSNTFAEPLRVLIVRKPQKRIRSPTLDADNSPVPSKKMAASTPERKEPPDNVATPGSARRVLGSIERSFNRVRHVLTPKKSVNDQPVHPTVLTSKDLSNVSTTQCADPEFVINSLSKALQNKGIQCERKGFYLRGKMEPGHARRLGGCSFELEICYLPSLGLPSRVTRNNSKVTPTKSILKNGTGHLTPIASVRTGKNGMDKDVRLPYVVVPFATVAIRRKRLKGDSWCYKKVCEEILALTATDFSQVVAESSV